MVVMWYVQRSELALGCRLVPPTGELLMAFESCLLLFGCKMLKWQCEMGEHFHNKSNESNQGHS